MSKIIVEDHCNGDIYASNSIDGAIFTIKIPIIGEDEKCMKN
jgi:hypothetical protein